MSNAESVNKRIACLARERDNVETRSNVAFKNSGKLTSCRTISVIGT